MTPQLFYVEGHFGRSINQNTTHSGPWFRGERPILLPLGEFIEYLWTSISTSVKWRVRLGDLKFVLSLKPYTSYPFFCFFLLWKKTVWPTPLWPEWRTWHCFDGTQMKKNDKIWTQAKEKDVTVPSWRHVICLLVIYAFFLTIYSNNRKISENPQNGSFNYNYEPSRLGRAADRQSTSSCSCGQKLNNGSIWQCSSLSSIELRSLIDVQMAEHPGVIPELIIANVYWVLTTCQVIKPCAI